MNGIENQADGLKFYQEIVVKSFHELRGAYGVGRQGSALEFFFIFVCNSTALNQVHHAVKKNGV
ncbi:MAG: hypothetical protein U9P10_11675 [Thermodesulfobacteriota bacterium]|nr:hypothetical protein [Thermodesulfobacteriota bacterium]